MNNSSVCHPSGSQTPCVRYLRLRANPKTQNTLRTTKRRRKKSDQKQDFCRRATQTNDTNCWSDTRLFFFFFAYAKVRSKESEGHLRAFGPQAETSSHIIYKLPKELIKIKINKIKLASVCSYLGSSGGWLVSAAYIDFLLSCLSRVISLYRKRVVRVG